LGESPSFSTKPFVALLNHITHVNEKCGNLYKVQWRLSAYRKEVLPIIIVQNENPLSQYDLIPQDCPDIFSRFG